jgi:hypothetical protein
MTEKQAKAKLLLMWENGEVPPNFTEEHSEYERAVEHMMLNGQLYYDEFF